MVISQIKDKRLGNYIQLDSEARKVNVIAAQVDPKSFEDTEDVVILTQPTQENNSLSTNGGMVVAGVGEFEKEGIFVMSRRNDPNIEDSISLLEIEAEGIRVAYYSSASELNRELLNELGVIDVLILNVAANFDQQLKAIKAIDPQIIIPLFGEGVEAEKFKTELGIKFEEMNKYKCRAMDFANEEFVLHGIELA